MSKRTDRGRRGAGPRGRLAMTIAAALALAGARGEIPQGGGDRGAAEDGRPLVRIGKLAPQRKFLYPNYPGALQSLLRQARQSTLANLAPEPVEIKDFADPRLKTLPFIYVNFADREDWTFTPQEEHALKDYLTRGGLIYVDAGITASFLRQHAGMGQHHSYAEWEADPKLRKAFRKLFPKDEFQPLKRTDPLFRAFYQGLPDAGKLPEPVRRYTVTEKWPDGTYSTVVLKHDGRPVVIATPIIAMGWGRNQLGQWTTTIRFRILEDTGGLTGYVAKAAYEGNTYKVVREDGGKDTVFCQAGQVPAWNREPSGKIRMFRYVGSPEINDFAHQFYTRFGINVIVYALTR